MAAQSIETAKSTQPQPFYVNVRVKLSALWTALLLIFAFLDIFSIYRPDFRAELAAGEVGGFAIGEPFLLAIAMYVVIPSLMVVGALVLRPSVNRIVNVVLAVVYALTIVVGTIGEWTYYVVGSAVEVALLAAIVHQAWTWPRLISAGADISREEPTGRLAPAR